jgi:fructose-specific phosphotransferase system IIC component
VFELAINFCAFIWAIYTLYLIGLILNLLIASAVYPVVVTVKRICENPWQFFKRQLIETTRVALYMGLVFGGEGVLFYCIIRMGEQGWLS